MVFTASQADQISGTLESQGHGAFTYYFLKRVSVAAHRQEREQSPRLLPSVETEGSIQIR